MTPNNLPDSAKHALDALAAVTALGAFAQLLPPLAAGLSIIWLSMQIYGWVEARFKRKPVDKS